MKKITKILLMFVLIISCFAGVVAFAGCKENSKTITNIGLSKEIKTEYKLNEKLDLLDAKLVVTFNDATQSVLIITNDMISGFDTTTAGQKTLTITYQAKEIKVDYVVKEDFNTIMSKTTLNLLNADKFEAKMQRYDVNKSWYDYVSYVKNGQYFKEKSPDVNYYEMYDLVNNKHYISGEGETDTEYNKFQIYGYALGLIYSDNEDTTFTEISTEIRDGKYVVKYDFKQGESSAMQVTAQISLDCKVEQILIENFTKITYSYTDVPDLTWDAE